MRREQSGGALYDAGLDALLPLILSFLPPFELVFSVPLVCRAWRDAARSRAVWLRVDMRLPSALLPRLDSVRFARGRSWREGPSP